MWLGDPEATKPYAQPGLGIWMPQNLVQSLAWGPRGQTKIMPSVVSGARGPQTLSVGWFGDPEAPKPDAKDPEAPGGRQLSSRNSWNSPGGAGRGALRPPNIMHSVVCGHRGPQALRTVWFRDQGHLNSKPYEAAERSKRAELLLRHDHWCEGMSTF